MRYLRGKLGDLRLWLRVVLNQIQPYDISYEPTEYPGHVQPLMSHTHVWGSCKWNGLWWYARCVYVESCTARIAC